MMIWSVKHTVSYVGLPEAVMCDVSASPFPCNMDCAHTLWVILLITSHTYFMGFLTHHILHILYGLSHSSHPTHTLWVFSLITSYTHFMGYLTHHIPHILYGFSHSSHLTHTLRVISLITSYTYFMGYLTHHIPHIHMTASGNPTYDTVYFTLQ